MPTGAGRYAGQFGVNLCAGLDAIADAAVSGRWREALAGSESIHYGTRRVREEAIGDALDAGADWWAIGQVLRMHPQAAFDQYRSLREESIAPAVQRPHLVLLFTTGLAGVHRPCREYGLDLDEPTAPAIAPNPRAEQIRTAAVLLGQPVWIRVTVPGDGGEPIVGLDVLDRWTSVAHDEVELAALVDALRAAAAA